MYSFPVGETENIVKKSLANLYFENAVLSGALYLTNERVVFVGYLPDAADKYLEEVSLVHIERLIPAKSLFIFQNVLYIQTIGNKQLKFVVSSRDEWMKAIERQLY